MILWVFHVIIFDMECSKYISLHCKRFCLLNSNTIYNRLKRLNWEIIIYFNIPNSILKMAMLTCGISTQDLLLNIILVKKGYIEISISFKVA